MKMAAFGVFLASTYLNPNQAGKEKNDRPLGSQQLSFSPNTPNISKDK